MGLNAIAMAHPQFWRVYDLVLHMSCAVALLSSPKTFTPVDTKPGETWTGLLCTYGVERVGLCKPMRADKIHFSMY